MKAMSQNCGPSADEGVARLIAGNERFLRGQARSAECRMRHWLVSPRATAVRNDPRLQRFRVCRREWIFDAGLGDLFVVRDRGNVVSPEIAGVLQYAATHLQTPLFVVLGHQGCGRFSAALATKHEGTQHGSRIQILVDTIAPALPELTTGFRLKLG